MRLQYFKHRALFDLNKTTNDIGFHLPWDTQQDDNHFLFRLYKKQVNDYPAFYQYHLSFFLTKYPDATEEEFFTYVKDLVEDTIDSLRIKDTQDKKRVQNRHNRLQLKEFREYLNTVDRWFIQSTDEQTIKRQLEEIARLIADNKKLKEENKKLRELETTDYIDIRHGHQRTLYHIMLQIRDLKLDDGKELTNAATLNIWCKMIAKYFKAGGKEISFESIKRYFPPQNDEDKVKYKDIPQKDQLFTIVKAKQRSL
ncbi:MAG: hypothetical protein JST19_09355 [Bacteroidetes bacterium]|nr:hypothetical protein [Bacteroidota bacterium]